MEGQLVLIGPDRWLADLADRQHGVVAWWQLRDAGFTRAAVDSRLARGRLYIVWRGVYTVGSRVLSAKGRWMAAVLTYGPLAALSHRTAANHLEILDASAAAAIHVTVPGQGTLARRSGVVVHRVSEIERTVHDGIPITTVAQTLLDLAASAPRRTVERAVENAERLRIFDLEDVRRLAAGRRGAPLLRAILADYDDAPTKREFERRFLQLCTDRGLPRPECNARVGEFEVDFLWRRERVVVEADSRRFHDTWQAAERDRERDAALVLAGFRTQRFTWRQLDDPRRVEAVLRAVLGI